MSKRTWRISWLAYALGVALVGTSLLFQAGADRWTGSSVTALTIITWGLQGVVWIILALLSAFFYWVTMGVGSSEVEQVVISLLVLFALGSAQFWLIRQVAKLFSLLLKRRRRGQ